MRVIDLRTLSLVGGSGIAEAKIPLWSADGTLLGTTSTTAGSGSTFLTDGSGISTNGTGSQLFTLSSSWSSSLKFALEATIASSSASGTTSCALWDFTSSAVVSGTTITTSSTTSTVIRSGQVTLVPGRKYGVVVWGSSSSYSAQCSDASLIAFPQ